MQSLQAYLNSDRQWPRLLRIRRARMMEKTAQSPEDRIFWRSVLVANGVDAKGRPLASTSYLASREPRVSYKSSTIFEGKSNVTTTA